MRHMLWAQGVLGSNARRSSVEHGSAEIRNLGLRSEDLTLGVLGLKQVSLRAETVDDGQMTDEARILDMSNHFKKWLHKVAMNVELGMLSLFA